MKPNIHPQYREVAFTDMSIGKTFIIRSTADARDTIEIDGDTVRSFDYNTLVAAGNNVDIDNNMTEQMLSDKKITFAAGNEVKCGKNILGYVKVTSTVGNKITETNE